MVRSHGILASALQKWVVAQVEQEMVPDVLLCPWLAILVVEAELRAVLHLHPRLEAVQAVVGRVSSSCPKLETLEVGMAVLMPNSHQKQEASASVGWKEASELLDQRLAPQEVVACLSTR